MSDLVDVSAKVCSVTVGKVELCRVVAFDGVMMIYYGPGKSVVLSSRLELTMFKQRCSDAQPESEAFESMDNALTAAAQFAFGNSGATRLGPISRPKDEMRDWVESMLGRRPGSIVKAKEFRKAWNDHLHKTHNFDTIWTPYKFHVRLREYGYKVEHICGCDGTGVYIVGVFMRDGRAPSFRKAKRKATRRKASSPAVC